MSAITIAQPRLVLEDPHNCTDMADALTVLDAVYDGLVRREGAGYGPALALTWEVAGNGRVWTFQLRPGVRFHDGAVCDAEAVIATLTRMARPDMGVTLGAPGVYAQYLKGATFEALGPLSVRITLAAPMADLLDLLVYGYVASPEVLGDPVARPCGTGPYLVEEVSADAITARANPEHWGGAPEVERITWARMPEAAERFDAFRAGRVAMANRLPQEGAPGQGEQDYLAPTVIIYLFNTLDGPLGDARVRRALNLALDRDGLVHDVLGGHGEPLHGPLSRVHPGYVAPAQTAPDLKAARALLAEAGHADGLVLRVDTPTALPDEAEALTAALAAQLAPLGVTFDLRVLPDRTEYAHMVRRSEMRDMCVFDSSPLSTYRVLREKIDSRVRGSWWLGYRNPGVEAMIDQAAETGDDGVRAEVFRHCHQALVADPPWLFCYCHTRRIGARGDPGWRMRADGVIDVRALPKGIADG